jgi:hypothetical protein
LRIQRDIPAIVCYLAFLPPEKVVAINFTTNDRSANLFSDMGRNHVKDDITSNKIKGIKAKMAWK